MNADIKKSFIGKTPFGMRILQYMKYLETELTDADVEAYIDKGSIEKAKVAMETALLASTADITSMNN
jgi:hypothetical protein